MKLEHWMLAALFTNSHVNLTQQFFLESHDHTTVFQVISKLIFHRGAPLAFDGDDKLRAARRAISRDDERGRHHERGAASGADENTQPKRTEQFNLSVTQSLNLARNLSPFICNVSFVLCRHRHCR
jgi:hypothetical protein